MDFMSPEERIEDRGDHPDAAFNPIDWPEEANLFQALVANHRATPVVELVNGLTTEQLVRALLISVWHYRHLDKHNRELWQARREADQKHPNS